MSVMAIVTGIGPAQVNLNPSTSFCCHGESARWHDGLGCEETPRKALTLRSTRPMIATALMVVAAVSTACTTSSPSAPPGEVHPGTIALVWNHSSLGTGRLPAWCHSCGRAELRSPTRLGFMTAGSGSCPSLPTTLDVVDPDTIRMEMAVYDPSGGACTADVSTTTVVVAIDPARIDVTRTLHIQLVDSLGGTPMTLVAPGLR